MGAERVLLDFKHVYLDVIKDNFNSGGGDSNVEEPACRAKENETLSECISGNASVLFFPSLRSVSILGSGSSIELVSVLTSSFSF